MVRLESHFLSTRYGSNRAVPYQFYLYGAVNMSDLDTSKNLSQLIPRGSCAQCKKNIRVDLINKHYALNHDNLLKQEYLDHHNPVYMNKKRKLDYEKKPNKCIHCSSNIIWERRRAKFCNSSCAAYFNNSKRVKGIKRKSQNYKGAKKRICHISFCIICTSLIRKSYRKTCSLQCKDIRQSQIGRISARSRVKRSKDEIALYELCNSYFNKVSSNEPIANGWDADILIHDHKIAILWNGPWHYREMGFSNHSLKQVQNRDAIKTNEFRKIGWEVIVYEDRNFSPQTAFDNLKSLVGQVGNAPTTTRL